MKFRLFFLSPDTGASTGSATADEKPKTLAKAHEALDASAASIADLSTQLSAAQETISNLTAERDQAQADLSAARESITSITGERDQARADLESAQANLQTLTGERDQARTAQAAAATNVARLEKLCGVHGIDPAASAPQVEAPSDKLMTRADFDKLSQKERGEFFAKGGRLA